MLPGGERGQVERKEDSHGLRPKAAFDVWKIQTLLQLYLHFFALMERLLGEQCFCGRPLLS